MNTARIKLVTWGAATLLGLGMAVYVGLFLQRKNEILADVDHDRMVKVLSEVKEVSQRAEAVIPYDDVKRGLLTLDWTGKPPPPPAPQDEGLQAAVVVKEPITDLLTVRAVRFDGDQPAMSEVLVKYTSQAKVTALARNQDGTFMRHKGEYLHEPLNRIRVVEIYPDAIEFAFEDDPTRAHEFVAPREYDLTKNNNFAVVAAGEEPKVAWRQPLARGPEPARRSETEKIGRDLYGLGFQDVQNFEENYPRILTEDVTLGRHRDPTTKRYDGIEITSVKAGSIAERHGAQEGDVVKSINGHPVTSQEEAIQFVKNNKDKYDVWEIEVWNRGQTRTVTYMPPKK